MQMGYYNTLVLSGGSIKFIDMLGALQYCYDNQLLSDVKQFIGTSAGAIVCYLLAIGYTPLELIGYLCVNKLFEDMQYFDIKSMISGQGAIDFSKFQDYLEKLTINKIGKLITMKDISSLFNKQLVITVYNYTHHQTEYITSDNNSDMPCLVALRMSCCLPLIFSMYKYMGSHYIDGGLGDNFPLDYGLTEQDTHRLGILIDMDDQDTDEKQSFDMIQHVYQLLYIPIKKNLKEKLKRLEHVDIIRITNPQSALNFTIKNKDKIKRFSTGYQVAREYFT